MNIPPHGFGRIIRLSALSVALLAGALSAGIVQPNAAGAATQTVTIDCNSLPPSSTNNWIDPADQVDVTFSNCTGNDYEVWDDVNAVVLTSGSLNSSPTITVDVDQSIYVIDSGLMYLYGYSNIPLYPEHLPSGTLQVTADATIGPNPTEMNVGADNSNGDGEHRLGGDAACGLDTSGLGTHVYSTIDIDISIAGTFTFRGVDTDPLSNYLDPANPGSEMDDPFLALYSNFDPNDPDAGIVGCNDDLNDLFGYGNNEMGEWIDGRNQIMEGHLPYFTAQLQPGTYTLVLSLWSEVSNADWIQNAYGIQSTTFEMWGPAGSICLAGDSACIQANLPTTTTTLASGPDAVVTPSFTG